MKKLKELDIGEKFIGYCIIRKTELKTKQNGEFYLFLELGDRSGRLKSKVWKRAETYYKEFKVGKVIKIMGKIQSYKDSKEIIIDKIRLAQENEYKLEELIPVTKKNINELKKTFYSHLNSIQDSHLKRLLEILFPTEEIWDNYLKTASGKLWHHNYLYGMVEQLVCLLDLADVMKKHFPRIQLDLIKCGIILHNIGKELEYYQSGFIDFTTEGRLIGHIILGYKQVENALQKIEFFPDNLRLQLLHLILSHHNRIESGSPVLPSSMEAIILNLLNEVVSTANAVERIVVNDQVDNSEWTKYNKLLNRFIYVGNKNDHDNCQEQSE